MDKEVTDESHNDKKVSKKSRLFRFLRNVIISFVVLLILLIMAGVAYTWYMGQNDKDIPVTAPIKTTTPTIAKPTMPGPNAKEGASVQTITSPVAPGENSSISVKTNPESVCKIKVEYNKVASTDSGLVAKTADEYGIVSWSWTVGPATPVGKWPVTVTCVWNNKSAVVVGDLVVEAEIND